MTNFYQINAHNGGHIICWLIERMAIIDHHDNNQSINQLYHNRFTALLAVSLSPYKSDSNSACNVSITYAHACMYTNGILLHM